MKPFNLFIIILILIPCLLFAVKAKRSVYPDPPINFYEKFNTNYGDVAAGYSEAVDLTLPVVLDHVSCANFMDQDVMLRVGASGGKEIIVTSFSAFAKDGIDLPGKIYMKYRSAAPTSGEIICTFW